MQLVEQHIIDRCDSRYAVIDEAAFKSKNLYNAALYEIRQAFIHEGVYLAYEEMDRRMQPHEAYKALPTKVSQQVLMLLHKNWLAFFKALKAYKADPSKFTGRPRLPKYKHKTEGRNLLIYTLQALGGGQSKQGIQGLIKPSGLPITIKSQQQNIDQVRIIPRNGYYVVEVVYSKKPIQAQVDPSYCAAIDLGVTNLAAITSNREGFVPQLVNGRTLKAINQWYNKRMKELTLCLPKQAESYTSQASFLDMDPIPTYQPEDDTEYHFSGKRIGRRNRLYRTEDGRIICADVNGSYNILRKRKPDAFADAGAKGLAAYVVQPLRLTITV